MKRFISVVLLVSLIFISCTESKKKAKTSENSIKAHSSPESDGWEPLFDGKSFEGWRGLGRDTIPKKHWTIEDGAIRKLNSGLVPSLPDGQPIEGGDLMTKEVFNNYELYFEWKISKAGNSGVKYNVSEEMSQGYGSKYAALGFEYQLLDDNDTTYVGKIKPTKFTASLYDMIAPKNTETMPIGKYNSSRILVDGNHVEHWLNGVKVIEFEFGSKRLDSLYRKSKYRDYLDFIKKRKSHIVLQNHKDDAWFRNIKVRRIDANK